MIPLHPKISGVWARQIAAFGEVKIEHAWPHGNEAASWVFPPGTSHAALHAGATVEVFDGGIRVWVGVLQEPGLDGGMSARGLWTEGQGAQSLNASGALTSNPRDAVAQAKARGALSWGDYSAIADLPGGLTPSDANSMFTVAGLLDAWADSTGVRWGVGPDGNVQAYADPTAPVWLVPHAAAGRGLTPAADDFATHLYGIYLVDADTRALTDAVADAVALAAYGRRVEKTVDLTNLGPITSTAAETALAGFLALAATRLQFADGLDLQAGQILTIGGAPAPLSQVRAGQVVRLLGVRDPRGAGGLQNHTDVLIGKSVFTTATQTLSIAPVNAAPRGLRGALSS